MTGACRVCGAAFEYDETKRGRRRVQCSKACTDQAHRDKRSAARQAARAAVAQPCETCAGPVKVSTLGRLPRWCSVLCRQIARGEQPREPLPRAVCAFPGCEAGFQPARLGVRCCSERHGKALWNRESRADGRQPNPEWDDRRRDNYHRRRALKAGTEVGRVVNGEVFERDGWLCGICGGPVQRALVWPDPMSASLDHVIPLSKGGPHVLSNVQLAHLGCNVEKGVRAA